jgi:hypothetical protein
LIGLFKDVFGTLDLKQRLVLGVDTVDFFLGQLLKMQELHEDLEEEQMVSLVNGVRGCCIEGVLLHDALEQEKLLELFFELEGDSRVVTLNVFKHVEDELVDLHFKLGVFVEEIGQGQELLDKSL